MIIQFNDILQYKRSQPPRLDWGKFCAAALGVDGEFSICTRLKSDLIVVVVVVEPDILDAVARLQSLFMCRQCVSSDTLERGRFEYTTSRHAS